VETVKALGAIFRKLELRDKEKKLGITQGLTPELHAYYKELARFDSTYRYPEDQKGYGLEAQDLFKKFYLVVEVCVLKYGEKGQTVNTSINEFLQSLRLDEPLILAAGEFIKVRANGQLRVIE